MLKIKLVLFLVKFIIVEGIISITVSSVTLSSYNTLDSSVSYNLVYNLSAGSIQVDSYATLTFTNRFLIIDSSLSDCKVSTSSGTPTSPATCSAIYHSSSDFY